MKPVIFALLTILFPIVLPAQRGQTAEIRTLNGQPALYVNRQPELPFLYALTHVSGGRWSWEELPAHNLRLMSAAGVRLFQVDLWLEDIWKKGVKKLDMALVRRQVRGVLDACPQASVVVRLHVNAPFWWNRGHPGECTRYADGPVEALPEGLPFNYEDGDINRALRASLASQRWREEAGARVIEFCRKLAKTREGKSVIGIHVSGGVYGEWHPWGFIKQEPDMSEPMQQAFRRWLKNKYGSVENLQKAWAETRFTFENAAIPDSNERKCCADGFFRDPIREQRLLDFYHCQQEIIADDIEFFCRTVKENWGRPLICGVFYGYMQFGLCRQAMNGHLEAERLLKSPWIDYFAGPPSYYVNSRKAGGSGLQRGLVSSVHLHGKMWFDEIDNGYLQEKRERDFVRSWPLGDTSYLPVLQRSLWLPMMQGCGLWLYDFGPRRNTGWWDSPLYLNEIRRTLDYFRQTAGQTRSVPAEALVLWDTESFYQIKNVSTKTCEQGLDAAAEDLQRCGVPADHFYLFDLERIDLRPYKAVIFMNAWRLTEAQRRYILDSVARDGRTLIWNYGAGYSDGFRSDKVLAEEITGFRLQRETLHTKPAWSYKEFDFENPEPVDPLLIVADPEAETISTLKGDSRVVLARKQRATHSGVYAGVPLHGSAVFRELLTAAGCAGLNNTSDFVFTASGRLLLHTGTEGKKTLFLKNGRTLEPVLPKVATRLLDAGTGAVILK